ncbi:hypothetical protein O6H91_10G022300 [Diphasiastrum complanatum]|uniref:Uncharacterized protein n=1 Tax=Diphasiastrum complanatum TaxID=34168 RepID=A0ACC2CEZ4_DIPCM|nr:hypothetical protein O6H91_10G022300 [Diphasiastrum complanatum]
MTMESRSKSSWLEPSYADSTREPGAARSTKPQEDLIGCLDDAYVTNEDGFSHTSENGSSENLQGGRLFEAVDIKNKRRVLIDIAVEIEDGKVEHIEIKDGDTAEEVATKFCHIHALPAQLVAPLTDHIVRNIMEIRTVVP